MKRKQEEAQLERYIFVVDAVLKHHQFSLEEVKFFKQVNLDGFVTRVTWGVLHEELVREAVEHLQAQSLLTTVQDHTFPLLAPKWRDQMQDVFQLSSRKGSSTKQWELSELFPSLKSATPNQESVKVSDCTYPGAKKPLKILSFLFYLNTSTQNYISIPFAELILTALNGNLVDWPEEFYQGLHEELMKLHQKHLKNSVKAVRTNIGPHLTLLIKEAGAMNLRHEAEAGFRVAKTFPTTQSTKRQTSETPPSPPLHSTVRIVRLKPTQQSKSRAHASAVTQPSVVIEREEPWQVPESIPNIIQQITQAHRRLENLLTSLAGKAPHKLMRNIGQQFHKMQREAILKEELGSEKDPKTSSRAAMTNSLVN